MLNLVYMFIEEEKELAYFLRFDYDVNEIDIQRRLFALLMHARSELWWLLEIT